MALFIMSLKRYDEPVEWHCCYALYWSEWRKPSAIQRNVQAKVNTQL